MVKDEMIKGLRYKAANIKAHMEPEFFTEVADYLEEQKWIPVSDRLPENANHLGAFCPRYMISSAKYGVTEGWYNPDMRAWYGLIWQLTPGNIEMKRGDIPAVIRMIDVIAWMPLPEPYKTESEGT